MVRKRELAIDFNHAIKHLREDNAPLSPALLGALSGVNRTELAAFAETWVTLPVERRERTVQMLVDLAEENFKHDFNLLFRYMLNDEDPLVRARAIDGLWEDEDVALVKPLIGFLRSDPDARVRAAAADSLGRYVLLAEYGRMPQEKLTHLTHEALLATIRSGTETTEVRARAIEALAYWGEDVMRGVIAAAYDDEDALIRASAIAAMGRSADTYWRKTAASELESPDPRMRFEAARAAGELEDREAVPRLVELLDDADREVQGAAITSLGQIGGKPAREALERAVDSEDEVVRTLADEALQELSFASGSDLLLLDLKTQVMQEQDLDDEELSDDEDMPGDEDMSLDEEDEWNEEQDETDLSEEDWDDESKMDDDTGEE